MRVWITDRWWGNDPVSNKKTVKKARFGVGSRWQVNYYEETAEGGRRLISRGFERLADAQAFRTKTEHELREEIYRPLDLTKKTFADAATVWLESRRRPTGASLLRYRDALTVWSIPKWGRRTLSSMKREEIDLWVSALRDGTAPHADGRRVRGGGLSPAGLTSVWVPFKASLARAVELGWLRSNPANGVELPRTVSAERVFLNFVEVEQLVAATREVSGRTADGLMIELMAFAGLRPGEVVALQVQNVDVEARRIRIRRTVTIDENGSAIFGEPKHGERRDVPIAPHLVSELKSVIENRPSSAPLIDSRGGHYVNIHNWRNRIWAKAVVAAGLDDRNLTPKALRHTAASMAIAAGADVKVVQQMLGHADASMTLNTYADLWPDRLDEVVEAVSKRRALALDSENHVQIMSTAQKDI